jgi:hypothetical protein
MLALPVSSTRLLIAVWNVLVSRSVASQPNSSNP